MAQQKQLIGHVKGDQGPEGPMGSLKSVEATVDNSEGVPSVEASLEGEPGNQTLKLDFKNLKGEQGATAAKGATFTPNVDEEGYLNWTNDQELPNPEKALVKGPKGDTGTISEFTVNVDDTHLDQPTATVQMGGEPGNQTITVDIKGIKGKQGDKGDPGTWVPSGSAENIVLGDGSEISISEFLTNNAEALRTAIGEVSQDHAGLVPPLPANPYVEE